MVSRKGLAQVCAAATLASMLLFGSEFAHSQGRQVPPSPSDTTTLDDLSRRYAPVPGSQGISESFTTARGVIFFRSSDIKLSHVPSTGQLAFMRIGKKSSTESAELIRAWIEEAAAVKQRLGYKLLSRTTRKSDYGEITEAEYKNGDMYFRTWYQFERVLESYRRHSLQYTYHIEIGSTARRSQYTLEQYKQKLGG